MTTTTASNAGSRAPPLPKERASVIITSPAVGHRTPSLTTTTGGMSDPVIDEHFRRSLGKDYMNVFAPAAAAQRELQQQAIAATAAESPSPAQADGNSALLSGIYTRYHYILKYVFYRCIKQTWFI